jgi:hypothetical protein
LPPPEFYVDVVTEVQIEQERIGCGLERAECAVLVCRFESRQLYCCCARAKAHDVPEKVARRRNLDLSRDIAYCESPIFRSAPHLGIFDTVSASAFKLIVEVLYTRKPPKFDRAVAQSTRS